MRAGAWAVRVLSAVACAGLVLGCRPRPAHERRAREVPPAGTDRPQAAAHERPGGEPAPEAEPPPPESPPAGPAAETSEWARGLPVEGSPGHPIFVLDLGERPPVPPGSVSLPVASGEVAGQEGAEYVSTGPDGVTVARKGFGATSVAFRFLLPQSPSGGRYTLWARWRQGGDPNACPQMFTVRSGPGFDSLEERAAFETRNPSPWQDLWVEAPQAFALRREERAIEIRNSGNAHDAKVFDAFLLVPCVYRLPPGLSARGTPERPLLVLEAEPVDGELVRTAPRSFRVFQGEVVSSEGADYVSADRTGVTAAHRGFGNWGVTFRHRLDAVRPGFYGLHVRYKGGGEPSQTQQTFTLRAGPGETRLGVRGVFAASPRTPWQYEWLEATGSAVLMEGDRVVEIANEGRADGAKVFDVFVLSMQRPAPDWMTAERGALRSRFLSVVKRVEKPERRLYVVDGDGAGDRTLFDGLAQDSVRNWYDAARVVYLLGPEADDLAGRLNLPARPAAVVVDADRKVIGVLSDPEDAARVGRFLADPGTGITPPHREPEPARPMPLKDGTPARWLVATGWPGRCGVGRWGLDAEGLQRPNPGELFGYAYYTAGNRFGRWQESSAGPGGVCVIAEQLADSCVWGRSTSYAVAYVHAERAVDVLLHLQHTGIQSAVYLDGLARPLHPDPRPGAPLPRRKSAPAERVVRRPGQEIHDDLVVPEDAEPPLVAELSLGRGWHCLVLKLVHAQDAGERVFFSARLALPDGSPPAGLRTQTTDPTAALGMASAASGLWPRFALEGASTSLVRPGEPLVLVADMRVTESFLAGKCPDVFLPIRATLSIRLTDYDGKELAAYSTEGVFPGVARLDLGRAPGPGYYALVPELRSADGRLVRRFHGRGFSVVLGNAAQKERLERKKVWSSWYYAFSDWGTFAPWLERMGLFKNVGSFPGARAGDEAKWLDARSRGIVLFADFAGDSAWLNNSEADAKALVGMAARYTRYFKSVNEIDGREGPEWLPARTPDRWVERAKWQHEALHAARADALYVGGSLYCSGVDRPRAPPDLGPRAWFRRCLELGLDRHVDAWDVHVYPHRPPRLEAPSASDGSLEADRGVLDVYAELGRRNEKPFFLGETSALVWHGFEGLRWQADTAAKLVAWVNSRTDWLGVAFCAPHHDRCVTAEEYAMAGDPGEAAIYTASALVDGMPYRRVPTDDPEIQAAWFGPTLMVWRSDDRTSEWSARLDGTGPWVLVDVVGRVRPFDAKGNLARLVIGASPAYVLPKAEYERLTRP